MAQWPFLCCPQCLSSAQALLTGKATSLNPALHFLHLKPLALLRLCVSDTLTVDFRAGEDETFVNC